MTTITDAPGNRVARKIRIRAVLFLGAAVIAGIAAVFLVKLYLEQARRQSSAAPISTVPVVVAAAHIPSGQRLEPAQLAVVHWPVAHALDGTFRRIDEVVGQTLRQDMVPGEPLLRDRLASRAQGQGLAAILDAGARAMAVKVDQVVGIAGFVQPGDRVDVITTIATDDETRAALAHKAAKISKIILQDIRVLAVGEHLSTDGNKPVKVQVVTLAVQPEQSERLALASQHGTIQLTMRSRLDHDTVETEGVTPLALLSPGARVAVAAPVVAEKTEKVEKPGPTTQTHRPHVTVREHAPEHHAEVVAPPAAPVIEILRGTTKIEERKLRVVGGAP